MTRPRHVHDTSLSRLAGPRGTPAACLARAVGNETSLLSVGASARLLALRVEGSGASAPLPGCPRNVSLPRSAAAALVSFADRRLRAALAEARGEACAHAASATPISRSLPENLPQSPRRCGGTRGPQRSPTISHNLPQSPGCRPHTFLRLFRERSRKLPDRRARRLSRREHELHASRGAERSRGQPRVGGEAPPRRARLGPEYATAALPSP